MFSLYFMKRAFVLGATAFAVSLSMNPVTSAQPFPNKPVKIIVTAAPGGTTYISSRALSEILGKELGQSVIIEN